MQVITTYTLSITVLLLLTAVLAAYTGEDLYRAARWGRLGEVKSALADPGVNIDWQEGSGGGTALQVASLHNHTAVVQVLVNAGANVNAKSDQGNTPISQASAMGNTGVVTLLIRAGASVDMPNNWGSTPLMNAAMLGHTSTVAALIGAHANVALVGENGDTALHLAAKNNHPETAALLLQAGAPTGTRNNAGLTPGEQARIVKDHNKLVDIIDAYTTSNSNSVWQVAAYLCGLSVFFIAICV